MTTRTPHLAHQVSWLLLSSLLIAVSLAADETAPVADKFTAALFHFDAKAADGFSPGATATLSPDGRFGGCLRLTPRASDADARTTVTLPAGALDPGCFSIDFWCKLRSDQLLARDMYLVSSPGCFFRYSIDRAALEFGVITSTGVFGVATTKDKLLPVVDRWYHLVGSYDGSEIRLSIDGKQIATAPASGQITGGAFVLGGCGWADERVSEMDGWLDELCFSNLPESSTATQAPAASIAAPSVDKPSALIPRTSTPPPITGDPTGPAWDRAVWLANPVYLNSDEISPKIDMRVGLLYDDDALYVGFRVFGFRKPLAVTTTHGDDGFERDDAVEVTLKVPGFTAAGGKPVQFKLNCAGLRDDAIDFDFGWNAKWDGAVKTEGNNWSATFRLPFAIFGVAPKPGDKWPANFAAFLVGYVYRGFLWSPVALGHHHQGDFGTIEFGGPDTVASSIGPIKRTLNSVAVTGAISAPGTVTLSMLPAKTATVNVPVAGPWTATLENLPPGRYTCKVVVADASGRALNTDLKPVTIPRSVEVRVLKYPVAASGAAVVRIDNLGKPGALPASLKLVLRDVHGAVVHEATQALGPTLPAEVRLPLGKLVNGGRYHLTATATSADGASVEDAVDFTMPPRPVWAGTDAGALHGRVPKPWTPITAKGRALSCWGRTYDFAGNLLPASIISSGHRILAAPMTVTLRSGDQSTTVSHALRPASIKLSPTGDRATFAASADQLSASGYLGFDGFLAISLTSHPKPPLTGLSVEIPLDPAVARYLQPLPGAANRDGAGAIPDPGVAMDPVNSLWICGDRAGLFFACESTEGWAAPEGHAIEVIRRGDATILRLNFPATARTWRFFLQATPIRPYNSDWFANSSRIGNGLSWYHDVMPLADDTVRSMPLTFAPAGSFDLTVRNRSDLAAISAVGEYKSFDPKTFDEHIARIGSPAGKLSLLYSFERKAMILSTPWGDLGTKGNCPWEPGETHTLSFTWGDRLVFLIDGKPQGELALKGLPLASATLHLGSISARYTMTGLDVGDLAIDEPLDLQSHAPTPLTVFHDSGGRALIFFEHWCNNQGGARSAFEPLLRNVVDDCHRAGLKVLFYFGFEMPEVPEFADMIDECRAMANKPPDFYAPAQQKTYWISYGGPYQEYVLYNMARLKRELGIDGCFLDGSLGLGASDNPAFGCGYDGPEGARVPTVPVERIRQFAQRVNSLFVPDGGFVFAHLGAVVPTMGYATNTYYGEHVGFLTSPWNSVTDCIPLDVTRAVYSGLNTGVPMVLCQQIYLPHLRGLRPHWYPACAAWADLHRIGINVFLEMDKSVLSPEGRDILAKERALADFGADRAEWIPYWDADKLLPRDPDDLMVSLYRRPDGAMLAVVANLTASPISGTVDLSSGKLSAKPAAHCTALVTGKPMPFADRKLRLTLPAYEDLVVRIE